MNAFFIFSACSYDMENNPDYGIVQEPGSFATRESAEAAAEELNATQFPDHFWVLTAEEAANAA